MHFSLEVLSNTRKFFNNFLEKTSLDDLNKIPQGFNNNMIWNIGHIVVTQQLLAYKLSGLPMIVSDSMVAKYMKDTKPEGFVEQLFADGCDDALIGIGQHGRLALDFTREASSAGEAVLSALTDVQRIVPGARLIEASPDFVGLTDIANILGFSRQNMRKLLVKSGPTFPLPVHDGKPAIWHLATILDWFAIEKGRDLDAALHEVSRVTMQCNLVSG